MVEPDAASPGTAPEDGGTPGSRESSGWAQAAKWIAALLLLAIGFLGVRTGIDDLRIAATPGQTIAALLSLAYGALGLVASYAVGMAEAWAGTVLRAWAVTMTVMVGMAPAVWGGAGAGAVVGAGAGTAAVALFVIWLARIGARGSRSEDGTSEGRRSEREGDG